MRSWERRAARSDTVIGVSCPKCWHPLQTPGYWYDNFCQCGEAWDVLEEVLAAHGLLGTSIQLVSSPDVRCG